MRLPDNFPTAEPGDVADYDVDFADYISAGTTISAVTWALSVRGTLVNRSSDATPASRRIGSPALVGSETTQRIGGLVDGNDYIASIAATLSNGEILYLWTILPCRAAGS